jgi:thiol-disulfide isomerase/thioredoxin
VKPAKKGPDVVTLVIVGLLLLGTVALAVRELEDSQLLPAGDPAPAFRFTRFEGGEVTLEGLRGQVVMVDFWATWCPPCREEMPSLVKLAAEFEPKGVRFVAVSHDDPDEAQAAVAAFARQVPGLEHYAAFGVPETGQAYLVRALPTLYLIDRDGRVVASRTGQMSEGQVRRWLERVVAGH